jgi:nucleotide-binding universal stress UspA family protein
MEAIVVGVDGSPASLDALSWAGNIAAATAAPLVVVRAGLPPQATLTPALFAELAVRAVDELDRACKERELVVTPTTLAVDQDPRIGLVAVAAEHDARLLVVGARGTSGLSGLLLGGVTQTLAHDPTRPLAVVPAGAPAESCHVVVGIDGSAGSLAAARFGGELARSLGVGMTATLAREPFAEWVPAYDPHSWQMHARKQVRTWVEPVADLGVPVDIVVERDIHPVAALTRSLEAHPGSIAVVGTRGRGGFAGLRQGRVPLQLLHHADAPVVIVPTPPA